jgi:thioredoxin-like negative regulator of GroEL
VSDPNAQLNRAIEAARNGDFDTAMLLLQQVVEKDPENPQAWLWLAKVVEDEEDEKVCLQNVLELDPRNVEATNMLRELGGLEKIKEPEEEVKAEPGIDDLRARLRGRLHSRTGRGRGIGHGTLP